MAYNYEDIDFIKFIAFYLNAFFLLFVFILLSSLNFLGILLSFISGDTFTHSKIFCL